MSKHGTGETNETNEARLRRDEIRMKSGRVMICAPIEADPDAAADNLDDVRFYNRMDEVAGDLSSYFFAWEYRTNDPDDEPRITIVMWDAVESIAPMYVNLSRVEVK